MTPEDDARAALADALAAREALAREDHPCKVDGCGGIYRPGRPQNGGTGAKGMCNAHYLRLLRYGRLTLSPKPTPEERFWRRVDQRESNGCWLWLGALNSKGYGRFLLHDGKDGRVRVLAHRYAYAVATGEDIAGAVLMHSCDNPQCVNPSHLTPGTQADNVADMWAKGRGSLPPRKRPRRRATS